MSTQFFERQEVQRSYTRWLVLGFITAILLVVAAINLIVLVGVGGNPLRVLRHNPEYVFWVSLIVLGTILIATWHKASQLRAGGAVVARQLGGIHINSNDQDFARQRLVNVVEEMAIAARIRKPQVFLLPDEPGINAFAAGNSPDEAAVAVTQGALDKLDRDQLQAVIGHEFSHILNGDMRLNMRLTAWIFGLFVITDLALHIMRGRSRGKSDGRIRLIAVAIFVAGSIGLLAGRLLQAAVSRRREHLADASSVQFTRNPQALQGAFIAMAANAAGSQLHNAGSVNMAHMLFAGSEPVWATKLGGSWFSTHPSLEERVRELDPRVSEIKFRLMVSDYRRKTTAQDAAAASAAEAAPPSAAAPPVTVAATEESYAALSLPTAEIAALPDFAAPVVAAAVAATPAPVAAAPIAQPKAAEPPASSVTMSGMALAETLPSGVRLIAGRALPPDVLRNRLSTEQQAAILATLAQVEQSLVSVQALYVATMLDSNPAKWRTQLTRLAPLLGIELFKETQAQIARVAALAPAARLPTLIDLLTMLDKLEPADRKRLRALARAFAPTVARRRHAAILGDPHSREAPGEGHARAAAGTVARAGARDLRVLRGAGAVPVRRRQAGSEFLPRRRHGHAAAQDLGAVSGSADHACGARCDAGRTQRDSSHRQAIAFRRHGASDRGGRAPDRIPGRSAARRLPADRLPGAGTADRCRLRRQRSRAAGDSGQRAINHSRADQQQEQSEGL